MSPETERTPGLVVLIGGGPGDPQLLTRAGEHWLSIADVIVYDHLIGPRLMAFARPDAERIAAGKSKGRCLLSQEEINALLLTKAREGKTVARLKGGDPYVFGRGAEEAEFLHESGIPFRIVPGVTSGVGVSAYAGIPLTHRGSASAVAFVTGHHDPRASSLENGRPRVDWSAIARFPGTVVVYMGVSRLSAISEVLIAEGLPSSTPAAVVASGTLPSQQTVIGTIADIALRVQDAEIGSPALLIVGDVVRHRSELNWFETGPLFGKTILVTRPATDGVRVAGDLEALGAEVLLAPTVEIRPLEDYSSLDATINKLSNYDWIVFTSPNGVVHFLSRIRFLERDLRVFGPLKIAAIGPATAKALDDCHLKADLIPPSYRSESLAAVLCEQVKGQRVLLARADRGRTLLKDELETLAHVDQVAVYRNMDTNTLSSEIVERIEKGTVDWITLTSSAITERLFHLLTPEARAAVGKSIRLASISPVTTSAANRMGWQVAVEATEHDWPGLQQALVDHLAAERSGPPDASDG